MRFEGVFVATVTPFDSSGQLDLAAYQAHLNWLADSGVNGFVPCGTTGEAPTLSREERRRVISEAIRVGKEKRIKVIAGCGTNDTESSKEQVLEAARLGCDGALIVTPYYNKPTPQGLRAHYHTLADASPIPIVVYHVPSRTGVSLSTKTVESLLDHSNVVGIKEASGQYSYWVDLSRSVDWTRKDWLAGDDDAFAITLSFGGSGIISAAANVIPGQFVELYGSFKAGNIQKAFTIQKNMTPVVRAAFIETNPAPVKYALSLIGKVQNRLRLPLVPVTKESEVIIKSAMDLL